MNLCGYKKAHSKFRPCWNLLWLWLSDGNFHHILWASTALGLARSVWISWVPSDLHWVYVQPQPELCLLQPWPQDSHFCWQCCWTDITICCQSPGSSLTPSPYYSHVVSIPSRSSMLTEPGGGWGRGSSPRQECHRFPLFLPKLQSLKHKHF